MQPSSGFLDQLGRMFRPRVLRIATQLLAQGTGSVWSRIPGDLTYAAAHSHVREVIASFTREPVQAQSTSSNYRNHPPANAMR